MSETGYAQFTRMIFVDNKVQTQGYGRDIMVSINKRFDGTFNEKGGEFGRPDLLSQRSNAQIGRVEVGLKGIKGRRSSKKVRLACKSE